MKQTISYLIFIFFTCLYFSSTVGVMNSSDAPQYALTQALVEEKSIYIEHFSKYVYPDYAFINNHMLSVRPIAESLFMIPFYLWGKRVEPLASFPYGDIKIKGNTSDSKLEALTVLGNATFASLMLIVLYLFVLELSGSQISAVLTVITGGLGTLFWRYSSQFQRFPFVSFFLISAFYLFYKINFKKPKHLNLTFSFLGLTLGFALITDPTVILISATLLVSAILTIIKKIKAPKKIFLLLTFFSIPLLIHMTYNLKAFNNPLTFGYKYIAVKDYYRDFKNYYSTPLFPSFFVNLISKGPIPESAFGNLWQNETFKKNEGLIYATKLKYLGILSQTPALIFSILGIVYLLWHIERIGIYLFLLPLAYIIQMSKYIAFFGPNSFDTHYFLPAIPFLLLGFGIFYSRVACFKTKSIRLFLQIIIFSTILISIYNGWYANLTNYAPHLSGEHRFDFGNIREPWYLSWDIINYNLKILILNTFPNYYNLEVLFAFYILPISLIYFLYYHFYYSKKSK